MTTTESASALDEIKRAAIRRADEIKQRAIEKAMEARKRRIIINSFIPIIVVAFVYLTFHLSVGYLIGIFILSYPYRIRKNVFSLFGGVNDEGNIYSLFPLFQEAENNAFSLFSPFLIQKAGNDAFSFFAIFFHQVAQGTGTGFFGISLFSKAGSLMVRLGSISLFSDCGDDSFSLFSISLFTRAEGNLISVCGISIFAHAYEIQNSLVLSLFQWADEGITFILAINLFSVSRNSGEYFYSLLLFSGAQELIVSFSILVFGKFCLFIRKKVTINLLRKIKIAI